MTSDILILSLDGELVGRRFAYYANVRGLDVSEKSIKNKVLLDEGKSNPQLVFLTHKALSVISTQTLSMLRQYLLNGGNVYIKSPDISHQNLALSNLLEVQQEVLKRKTISKEKQYSYSFEPELHYVMQGQTFLASSIVNDFVVNEVKNIDVKSLGVCGVSMKKSQVRNGWFITIEPNSSKGGKVYCDFAPIDSTLCDSESLIMGLGSQASNLGEYPFLVVLDSVFAGRIFRVKQNYFDLIIDDRPTGMDWFTKSRTQKFITHVMQQYGNAFIDFAWPMDQPRVSKKLLDFMRQQRVGFVYHGFDKHIKHDKSYDYRSMLKQGQLIARRIEDKYGIRLQRVMVFPFHCGCSDSLKMLSEANYLCSINATQYPRDCKLSKNYLCGSTPFITEFWNFPLMKRYHPDELTSELMLAHMVLGVPIIAYGHPKDVGISRTDLMRNPQSKFEYFDNVLCFAKKWNIDGGSIDHIARQSYLERSYGNKTTIKMATNEILLENNNEGYRSFVIEKTEENPAYIKSITLGKDEIKSYQYNDELKILEMQCGLNHSESKVLSIKYQGL